MIKNKILLCHHHIVHWILDNIKSKGNEWKTLIHSAIWWILFYHFFSNINSHSWATVRKFLFFEIVLHFVIHKRSITQKKTKNKKDSKKYNVHVGFINQKKGKKISYYESNFFFTHTSPLCWRRSTDVVDVYMNKLFFPICETKEKTDQDLAQDYRSDYCGSSLSKYLYRIRGFNFRTQNCQNRLKFSMIEFSLRLCFASFATIKL